MPSIDTVFGIRNHPTVAPLHQADPFDPFRTVRIGIVMFTREVEFAWLQQSDLRRDVLQMQLKFESTKPDLKPEALSADPHVPTDFRHLVISFDVRACVSVGSPSDLRLVHVALSNGAR